ncbi:UDP-glucuronic acid decarboxylase 1-like isoform X2 [Photinus pyralis]|uniref:UDP-glucuronic acid decarboxylase 1-like isoform X2 n=1 Tax=Photinus pyralis TaxID=7054 RepID=UPI0012673A5E|nr:UDP-glucuronic acid decarboxylase 1-like isoform X2 [Photinus pyralis]
MMIHFVTKLQAFFTLLIIILLCTSIYITINNTKAADKRDLDNTVEKTYLLKKELEDAAVRIMELEQKLESLESRVPRKYAEVTFLNYLKKKRILITGGAGFVGSHLVDTLMLQGHEVIVADNFFTGLARRVNATILIASTSEVYGDPDKHPQEESYWGHVNPIGPRACYDEGKRVSETLTYAYAKQENMQVRVARIFNTYGPRMHMNDGRVVSNFILQALQDHEITVYGYGNQTRSFQYVSDLVDGLMALMESNYTLPVNIGNPVEHTINEFATIIKELVGGNSEIKHVAQVEDDPQRRRPDISRAKKFLNWEPKVSLNIGLHKTVNYFKKELKLFKLVHWNSPRDAL